jgi:hypothetical protein
VLYQVCFVPYEPPVINGAHTSWMVTKQNISISVLHFTETVILSIIRERNSEAVQT